MALDEPGLEGAEALATYVLDLYPYVYGTGDLAEWESLSHPDCIFCASVADKVEELHRDGEYDSRGGFIAITSMEPAFTADGLAELTITADQTASAVIAADGSITSEIPATSVRLAFFAEWLDEHWVVREVDIDDEVGTP